MRCYIHPAGWGSDRLEPDPEECHHLLHVLRVKRGGRVEALDGAGRIAECEVVETDRHRVALRVGSIRREPRPEFEICLVMSMLREANLELVLQKATELQVSRVVLVQAGHSVVRVQSQRAEKQHLRWERIVTGALKQSGNPWRPELEGPLPLSACLKGLPGSMRLLAAELVPHARPLGDVLGSLPAGVASVAAMVGPEGDYTPAEKSELERAGAIPVSLGGVVLRAETAALYLLSVLHCRFRAGGG